MTVNSIVYCSLVVLLENANMNDTSSHKSLLGNLCNNVLAIAKEDNYIVYVGTFAYKFGIVVAFEIHPHKSLGPVCIEFGIGGNYFCCLNGFEVG